MSSEVHPGLLQDARTSSSSSRGSGRYTDGKARLEWLIEDYRITFYKAIDENFTLIGYIPPFKIENKILKDLYPISS